MPAVPTLARNDSTAARTSRLLIVFKSMWTLQSEWTITPVFERYAIEKRFAFFMDNRYAPRISVQVRTMGTAWALATS
jgi:hypothetical protein